MVKRYQITYILTNDPYRTKHSIWKFGTSADEIEKTFNQYVKEPTILIEVIISDDED